MKRFLALIACVLLLGTSATAQSIDTSDFAGRPGSPMMGQLHWITDGSGDPTVGAPAAGGGDNRDLIAWDASQSRWEFVQRLPATAPPSAISSVIAAERVAYANQISGLTATDVQAALDELADGGLGGGTVNLGTQIDGGSVTVTTDTGGNPALIPAATTTAAGAMTAADRNKLNGASFVFPVASAVWASGDCLILARSDLPDEGASCNDPATQMRFGTQALVRGLSFAAGADSTQSCRIRLLRLAGSEAPGSGSTVVSLLTGASASDQTGEQVQSLAEQAFAAGDALQISIEADSGACDQVVGSVSVL